MTAMGPLLCKLPMPKRGKMPGRGPDPGRVTETCLNDLTAMLPSPEVPSISTLSKR